jgi:hypothetical protein
MLDLQHRQRFLAVDAFDQFQPQLVTVGENVFWQSGRRQPTAVLQFRF